MAVAHRVLEVFFGSLTVSSAKVDGSREAAGCAESPIWCDTAWMRRAIAWVLSVIAFLVVIFFTFPWFCSGTIIEYEPGYQGPNESWSACGTMGILLRRDVSLAIQIPVSLLLAFSAAYVVRRLALKGEKRSLGVDPA
jgi:hypothetical protein